MLHRPRLLTAIALCLSAGSLLAAGCGGDDDGAGAGTTTAGTTTAPAPLAIEERVVSDGLGGLEAVGEPRVSTTPETFARLVEDDEPAKEAAELGSAGFVEGAVQSYAGGEVFGLSVAVQLGSPEQAQAQAERIAQEFKSDLPPNPTIEPLPGVPGSESVTASGTGGGQSFEVAGAVFTDGPFLYVQLAGGSADAIDPEATLADATALYERVEGSPAP
jgi:hypothetical protein